MKENKNLEAALVEQMLADDKLYIVVQNMKSYVQNAQNCAEFVNLCKIFAKCAQYAKLLYWGTPTKVFSKRSSQNRKRLCILSTVAVIGTRGCQQHIKLIGSHFCFSSHIRFFGYFLLLKKCDQFVFCMCSFGRWCCGPFWIISI